MTMNYEQATAMLLKVRADLDDAEQRHAAQHQALQAQLDRMAADTANATADMDLGGEIHKALLRQISQLQRLLGTAAGELIELGEGDRARDLMADAFQADEQGRRQYFPNAEDVH